VFKEALLYIVGNTNRIQNKIATNSRTICKVNPRSRDISNISQVVYAIHITLGTVNRFVFCFKHYPSENRSVSIIKSEKGKILIQFGRLEIASLDKQATRELPGRV
jgi:hypothetical protein